MLKALLEAVGLLLLCAGALYLWWVHFEHRWTTIARDRVYQSAAMHPLELLRRVRQAGIDTVIDFRGGSEAPLVEREREALAGAGLRHVNIPSGRMPTEQQLRCFVSVMEGELAAGRRVLLHCKDGEGRAVAYAAIYRIEFAGWSPMQAWLATTRLPPSLGFIARLMPRAGRLSRSNCKTGLILAYPPPCSPRPAQASAADGAGQGAVALAAPIES